MAPDAGGNFSLGIEGTYQVKGEPADPNSEKCPRIREMVVSLSDQVIYELSGPQYECNSPVARYQAILDPAFDPGDYLFLWRNSAGEIIDRNQQFSTPIAGEFSLEVQPRIGTACPGPPITFNSVPFVHRADIELNAESGICFDNAPSDITADFDVALNDEIRIEWHRELNGSSSRIPEFDGMTEISVNEPGIYRAFIINETSGLQCIIGTDEIEIFQSDAQPPVLAESYTICAIEGLTTTLDSLGNWSEFEWWLDGDVVSNDSTFTPTEPGNYELIVSDEANCQYNIPFEIIEDCDLNITIPSGLIPDNPEKNFVVYVNDFVDEIAVLIYNRWGELIYHCIEENVPENSPFCRWDGKVNGKNVPVGTYPVIVKYKSQDQNLEKTIKKAIVVVE